MAWMNRIPKSATGLVVLIAAFNIGGLAALTIVIGMPYWFWMIYNLFLIGVWAFGPKVEDRR